jgi:hypothetical protein
VTGLLQRSESARRTTTVAWIMAAGTASWSR